MNDMSDGFPTIDDMATDWEAEKRYWDLMAAADDYAIYEETCLLADAGDFEDGKTTIRSRPPLRLRPSSSWRRCSAARCAATPAALSNRPSGSPARRCKDFAQAAHHTTISRRAGL